MSAWLGRIYLSRAFFDSIKGRKLVTVQNRKGAVPLAMAIIAGQVRIDRDTNLLQILCQLVDVMFNNKRELLVVRALDSRSKGCGIESCLIQYTRWKWGKSHARIDSCTQFWFNLKFIEKYRFVCPRVVVFDLDFFNFLDRFP